jgi:DNA-binding HxlR family transcriptional regulator
MVTVSTKINRKSPPASGNIKGPGAAGCGVDYFLKLLAREWMSHIVWTLARTDAMRFGALRRALPGAISARVLSSRLKELEAYGLVSRYDARKMPLHVEYRLTAQGRRLDVALRRSERLTEALGPRAIKNHKPGHSGGPDAAAPARALAQGAD